MVIGVVGLVSTVVHHRVGGFLVALALVAVGLAVAARGWNLAVSIADDSVTVRGLVRSRTIPRRQQLTIGEAWFGPALIWESDSGRPRHTPVLAFRDWLHTPPEIALHNSRCVRAIDAEIGGNSRARPPRTGSGHESTTVHDVEIWNVRQSRHTTFDPYLCAMCVCGWLGTAEDDTAPDGLSRVINEAYLHSANVNTTVVDFDTSRDESNAPARIPRA